MVWFGKLVDVYGPQVVGVMGEEFAGTCREGPNLHDLIGTHQRGGGLVEVSLDLQKGAG